MKKDEYEKLYKERKERCKRFFNADKKLKEIKLYSKRQMMKRGQEDDIL